METAVKDYTTKERLHQERRRLFIQVLQGGALSIFGGGCFWMVYRGGNRPNLFEMIPGAVFLFLFAVGLVFLLRALYRLPASHTTFGRSLLSQCPGKPLKSIMEQIDEDLAAEHHTFGTIAVGTTWAVGDRAMYLPRICGIFTTDTFGASILCLVDVDGNNLLSMFATRSAVKEAAAFFRERLPRAAVGDEEDYRAFLYLDAKTRRKRITPLSTGMPSRLAFFGEDGIPTSNFTPADVRTALEHLECGHKVGFLLLDPVEQPDKRVLELFAQREKSGLKLTATCENPKGCFQLAFSAEAPAIFDSLERLQQAGQLPDMNHWERLADPGENKPYELHVDGSPYLYNTSEDVAAALEGMYEGTYHSLSIMRADRSSGGLFVDKTADGYRVIAAVPSGDGIRWLETETNRKDQICFWMERYYTQSVFPYLSGWKDITLKIKRIR